MTDPGRRAAEILPRGTSAGPGPLSFAQQRLWFLDQLEPNSPFYNMSMALQLTGQLDLAALHRSLDTVVARHEVLRATFPSDEGKPRQVVVPAAIVPLPIDSVAELPGETREQAVLRIATEAAQQPFDLARGPLVRTRLIPVGPDQHVLLIVMHHIVSDGWSTSVLFRELGECYRAFHLGGTPRLPELPIQYADYAAWQQAQLQGERLERHLEYWRSQFPGAPAVLELPTDRPRPAIQTYRGARQQMLLPGSLSDGLNALGRQERVTLFMVLLAAFQTLLGRYTGRRDIVVATPIAGRTNLRVEGLVGLFVNTLALRTDLSGDPSFRQLLGRVREVALGAYAHQDLPFEQLVEALQPERSRQHTPLVQVMLALQNAPRAELDLPGLTVRRLRLVGSTAKFDLSLVMRPDETSMPMEAEYSTDLFDAASIVRLLGHFETLLQGIVANPDRRLSGLPILTEAERLQIVVEWNAVGREPPCGPCVHELIEAQAALTPDAMALVSGVEQLTYRELDRRAGRLAQRLRSLGVGPETRVALLVDRTPDLVVGLLAILKAGGVYVPLDPGYPPERLRFMIEDSGAAVVVRDRESIAGRPAENAPGTVSADHLAYVIYTSGSTGKPKGVAISHGALARHCRVVSRRYGLSPSDRVLQFSASSWDASLEQILATLLAGATLVLRGPEVWTAAEFRREMLSSGVTLANLPTAYFDDLVRQWAEEPELAPVDGRLRLLVVGGEAMRPDTVRLWRRTPLRSVQLLNGYGPTETTITATAFDVADLAGEAAGNVPLGRPLETRTAYVLDRHLNPGPVGVPGELCLGGASLARGYLNRPGLTAERFIPDQFGATPGARLYRTGDRVRYLPDGTLEFLGRLDQQMKFRGYRIEPGEIEATLDARPEVRQSLVMLREDRPGDRRLVAYLVPEDPSAPPPSASDLRDYVRARLPAYMVPSAFIRIPALPLTSQGKVNRPALPPPDPVGLEGELAGRVAPRTPVEELLAGIWAEVLGLDQVGVHDDFFALGGHSLLATQVVSRIRRVFQVELPLGALFEAPTLAELAERIDSAQGTTDEPIDTPVLALSRDAYRDTSGVPADGAA